MADFASEINNKITKVQFGKKKKLGKKKVKIYKILKKNIISFFNNRFNKLEAKINLNGKPIQKNLERIKKIKKGKVKTYGEIAKKFGGFSKIC